MRSEWNELPGEIRESIEAQTGPISGITPAPSGNHADIAATLDTPHGRMFVKAARKLPDKEGPEFRSLRWESAVNPFVSAFAPRLLWQAAAGEWLVLGFEHIDARHADYSPGSPDLALLATTLHALQSTPCPDLVKREVQSRWTAITQDVTPMAGGALLHTDVNGENLLITPNGRAYVVDWAFVSRGAAWVELALLLPWLLKAGHTPGQAEEWLNQFPSWTDVDPATLDMFAEILAERWRQNAVSNPADWAVQHATVTQQWTEHRSSRAKIL